MIFSPLKISLLAILIISAVVGITPATQAQQNEFPTLVPKDCAQGAGIADCDLDDVYQTIINAATIILALTGSAALLMFTYGGAMFILAAGQADRVTKAKDILKTAVIGLVVILGAWLIINAVILTLTEGRIGGQRGAIFGDRPFDQPPTVDVGGE